MFKRIRYLDVVEVTRGFYVGIKGIAVEKHGLSFLVKTPGGLLIWVPRWKLRVYQSEVADKFRNLRVEKS